MYNYGMTSTIKYRTVPSPQGSMKAGFVCLCTPSTKNQAYHTVGLGFCWPRYNNVGVSEDMAETGWERSGDSTSSGPWFFLSFPFYLKNLLFWLHPQHAEFPRPGIKPAPQQQLEPLHWQCQILNLLSHMGTPGPWFSLLGGQNKGIVLVKAETNYHLSPFNIPPKSIKYQKFNFLGFPGA